MLHNRAHAALLAYEPFTNPPGASIIGSAGGLGFSGAWQANSSGGVATNTGYALAYTDSSSNVLITTGGAGFFQGLTSANTSMQPTRMLTQARGTNGTDGVTTWISFLAVRQGPSVAGANPFPRGANIAHDINANALQKLAAGNSSGASSNTVGLIPQGNSANLKSSAISFSSTNLIIVRIDHLAGSANDNAYLFVNPSLATEPAVGQANASSLGSFDFSFDRIRVFAGGNASASQPYAELVIDEYRVGETYADVTPHTSPQSPVTDIVITNIASSAGKIVISGAGGPGGGTFLLLATGDLAAPVSTWPVTSTNHFDSGGLFNVTSSVAPPPTFYRLQVAPAPPANPPVINAGPTNVTVLPGQSALFGIDFTGDAPLSFQWFFNTNAPIANGTNATLNLAGVQATNAGSYSVRVTNSAGSATSGFAILTVLAPPAITSQPSGLSVAAGSSASFSVTALGSGTLSYQWYFNTNTVLTNA
ncbi:MAG TPA: immunoglobulin domain-containing protein, partial [Verrucomicrobiae bacterium]|nr:immunoglobulin domain-containing protein [Verrucomicrobiae bacterium]